MFDQETESTGSIKYRKFNVVNSNKHKGFKTGKQDLRVIINIIENRDLSAITRSMLEYPAKIPEPLSSYLLLLRYGLILS